MKLLFVGDVHNQVRTPSNRTDDFHDTFRKKVKEIKEIAKEEGVRAILQPGDFLNAPQYNNDFILDVIDLWSFVPEKYELLEQLRNGEGDVLKIAERLKEDIPYIGAIGNHELIGESLKSYPRTSLAFMEKIGFMTMASKEEPIVLKDEDGTTVAITAAHYHHGMDDPEHVDDYIVEEKAGDVHIHMAHGYLAHKSLGDLIKHTLVDSIKDTKADITLAGHDHIGFNQVEIDGKLFANPGSLTRTKADVKEISRMPKVLIIEIKDGKVNMTERLLKSAEAGRKVLDRTSITKKASKLSKIESIKSIVKKAGISKGQSVTDIVEAVAKAEGIEETLTEDVVQRVTEKIEVMGKGESASVGSYRLSQIVLDNFQSHKHSVFDVSEGLNIFTGESSNGKSAVMRAMRWLMDNSGKTQRESFIRHGADKARVTAVFDNGIMVSRVLDRKLHGDNGWEIYDPLTGETESGNTQLAEQIREIFGFTKVQYDTNDALDVNFMNQGDGWYFIGNQVKSSDRAKIIGAIFGTHYTDAVMKDLEKEIRQIRSEVRVREKDAEKVNEEIKQFDYLDDVQHTLMDVEALVEEYMALNTKKEQLNELIERKTQLDGQHSKIDAFLSACKPLDEASQLLEELKVSAEQHQHVIRLLERRTRIISDGRSSRKIVKELEGLEDAKQLVDALAEKQNRYAELETLEVKRTSLTNRMNKELSSVETNKAKVALLQREYKQLLEESGTCPTCGQAVDAHTLDEFLVHN